MPRQLISSGSKFEAEACYSRAVLDGDFVFVSGTTGFDYSTMTISADVVSRRARPSATSRALQKAGLR
jgi:enamine deaminase RidA (YjgF/YER057c/UK114 family)